MVPLRRRAFEIGGMHISPIGVIQSSTSKYVSGGGVINDLPRSIIPRAVADTLDHIR